MPPERKFAAPALLAIALATTSACARPEPPRTASDFCPNSRRITVEVAPAAGVDDPGNRWDSDETVGQALEHNAVVDRLCKDRP